VSNPFSIRYACPVCGADIGQPCTGVIMHGPGGYSYITDPPNGYHVSRYPANGYLSDSDGATMQFLTDLIVRGNG